LAREYIKDVWNATKGFLEQAIRYLTDATVSDNLLRCLLDPAMDQRLTLAYAKLDELMAVHKEHPETRNHYFIDRYNILQRKQSEAKTTEVLDEILNRRGGVITKGDIPQLLEMLHKNAEADMDLIAAESTFNAMEAFYRVRRPTCAIKPLLNHSEIRSQ
jgi:hypothetical protein